MCGISGLLYFDPNRPVDSHLLEQMTNILTHRGPDDAGHHIEGAVGLGSRRLSIIGLGDGHMPMSTEDESIWVVYNGELYNHPYIRDKLISKGHRYRTNADTESFLHLYREYGEQFLEYTRGMFAVALWDRPNRKLILGRDRLGIKPLYYQVDHQGLRFASEIKSILCDPEVEREIDIDALNLYLAYLATPAPYTMLKNIRQLNPGEQLVVQRGAMRRHQYWRPQERIQPNHDLSPQQAQEELAHRLHTIVGDHLLADVPVGAFLSGGIDSGIMVGLMRQHLKNSFNTFSIGFEGHGLFDETHEASLMASQFSTHHHEHKLAPNDLINALDDITRQLDEPLADSSCLPVYYVSQLAAQHGKVVVSGDGGDEMFAGYQKYLGEHYRRYVSWLPDAMLRRMASWVEQTVPESRSNAWMDRLRQVKKFFRGLDGEPFERHRKWALHFEDAYRGSLLHPDVAHSMDAGLPRRYRQEFYDELQGVDDFTRMLWTDLRHGLPSDMLTKVDRMSMLHSLEVRVPFLDHELVEFAFSLPSSYKLHGNTTKWILKQAFQHLLPNEIINRRKHGFDVPVGEWFRHELRDMIDDVCSEQTVRNRGLFNPQPVNQLLQDHVSGHRDHNNQLWILLSLELWQRHYLDRSPTSSSPT